MTEFIVLVTVVAIICSFVFFIPLLYGVLLPILKPFLSKNASRYLYAFSSGFFLIVATVLFIGESKEHLLHHFQEHEGFSQEISQLILAGILSGFVLLGLLVSLGVKYLFAKRKGNEIFEHENHDKMIFNITDYNPKSKALAIFFLLSHRIPDGLIIGLLCSQIAKEGVTIANIVFLCSFVIHIIPEELIIYYRQIEMGIKRKNAIINSLIAVSIIVPLIILGSIIGWYSLENELAIHIIQLIAASFLLFISIIEFLPEFLHIPKMSGKEWYKTILVLIIGISTALFILCFHNHSTHEHVHQTFKILSNLTLK